jgi:broad specificity phosphatase PhoE
MTTFYICRHGQTENNKKGRLSGWIDTPLTDEGVKNAHDSAAKLENTIFDLVVSSDLGRAFVTAYIISHKQSYGAEIIRLSGLREVNYGDLANLPIDEAIAAYPAGLNVSNNVAPNGESLVQMQHRVLETIQSLSEQHHSKTILIVAHDGTINALYASFAGLDIGEVDTKRSNAHDFVAKFNYDNQEIVTFSEIIA